jgi:tetratricopeptide (TPR) repeat protein
LNKVIALGQFAETLYPTRPYVARARILLFLDKPEQARHDLLMARHLDAGAADVQGELWKACVISEKYHLANHVVEEAMGSGSKDRFLSVCRSLNRLIMGKFNKARDLAEKACAENPEYEFAYWARANVYFSLGDYEKALKDYDKGLLLYDGNVYLRASKAYLLACCPDVKYRDAKEAVGLALSVSRLANEQNPRWLMLVAMAWAQDGNYAEAARSAKTALDRARPDFPLRKEYERRLKLFEEKKPYRFKPGSKVFDYFGL